MLSAQLTMYLQAASRKHREVTRRDDRWSKLEPAPRRQQKSSDHVDHDWRRELLEAKLEQNLCQWEGDGACQQVRSSLTGVPQEGNVTWQHIMKLKMNRFFFFWICSALNCVPVISGPGSGPRTRTFQTGLGHSETPWKKVEYVTTEHHSLQLCVMKDAIEVLRAAGNLNQILQQDSGHKTEIF